MREITEYLETELNENLAMQIATLSGRSFTSSTRSLEDRITEMLSRAGSDDPQILTGRRFVVWQADRVIAHARTFVRHISIGDQEVPVLALATVCSDPEMRGQGLGGLVTHRAFEQVGRNGWPEVSLFQTPVPVFYEKLNCRIVTNRFVNLLNADDPQANPWRDDTVMIYPSGFDWPNGVVNLNGPDY